RRAALSGARSSPPWSLPSPSKSSLPLPSPWPFFATMPERVRHALGRLAQRMCRRTRPAVIEEPPIVEYRKREREPAAIVEHRRGERTQPRHEISRRAREPAATDRLDALGDRREIVLVHLHGVR